MIYKIYQLGSKMIVQKRKSIPNIEVHNFKFEEVNLMSIIFRVFTFLIHKKTYLKMFHNVSNK